MERNRRVRRKCPQLFGRVIDKPIHVLCVKPARNYVERASSFVSWRTRWRFLRHSSFGLRHFANALEQVPELRLFCLEIFFVVRIGFGPDRHLLDHFQTVALEPDNFLRVICEEPELSHAQIEKNLCAEPVIAKVSWVSQFRVGLYGVESFLL